MHISSATLAFVVLVGAQHHHVVEFHPALQGQYFLPSGATTTLSVVGRIFEENIKAAGAPAAAATAAAAAAPVQLHHKQQTEEEEGQDGGEHCTAPTMGHIGPTAPPAATAAAVDAGGCDGDGSSDEHDQAAAGAGAGGGGAANDMLAADGPVKRVVGPALPPAEVLAAAAAYHEGIEAAGGYEAVYGGEGWGDEEEEEPLVGPPPPDMVEEVDAVPQNEREAEVLRVLKVMGWDWEVALPHSGHEFSGQHYCGHGGHLMGEERHKMHFGLLGLMVEDERI
jgi:hypothetical protein